MENLGAITFRETALLVDEHAASRSELERIADVVSHENAQMCFGDLVTMRWWNGLWLNEAFATFMEILAVDDWKPEWQRWTSFSVSRAAAMLVDGLKSTRPIEFPVHRPEEAAGMFDVLTYQKGAAVLRMLEQYLGGETFAPVTVEKHQFDNTETTACGMQSKNPPVSLRLLMDSWVFQLGYPLLSVRTKARMPSSHSKSFVTLQDGATWMRREVPPILRAGQTGTQSNGADRGETRTLSSGL
jgi:puromycin-sensitive aminopeptidase